MVAGRLERSDSLDSLRLSESQDSDVVQVSQTTTPRRQSQDSDVVQVSQTTTPRRQRQDSDVVQVSQTTTPRRQSQDSDVVQVSQTTTPRRQRQLLQQQQMRAEEDAWLIPESVVIDADGTTFQQQERQLLTRHEKVLMRRALSQFRETGYVTFLLCLFTLVNV